MSDPKTFIAFAVIMLVIALLGIAIDWFGKPLKHRRFVPKIYRFPEERVPRGSSVRETHWSDRSFILPVSQSPMPQGPPAPSVPAVGAGHVEAPGSFDSPGRADVEAGADLFDEVPVADLFDQDVNGPVEPVDEPAQPPTPETHAPRPIGRRARGWNIGDYVFNLTDDGSEPPPRLVQERYWKNVSATKGAAMFGADNVERMSVGRNPRRRNPRTGQIESMALPAIDHRDMMGQSPVPQWPTIGTDPFAEEAQP